MTSLTLTRFTQEQIDRFWSNFDKTPGLGPKGDCWEWSLYRNKKGYGNVNIGCKEWLAHRVAYFLHTGDDPGPLKVLHCCDNPPCGNPGHLFKGTDLDNARDRDRKGRNNQAKGIYNGRYTKPECTARGERNGSALLTEQQVRAIRAECPRGRGIDERLTALAPKYGVSKSTIRAVVYRYIWRHLTE